MHENNIGRIFNTSGVTPSAFRRTERISPFKALVSLALALNPRIPSRISRDTSLPTPSANSLTRSSSLQLEVEEASFEDENDKFRDDDDWMFFDRARVKVKAGDGGDGCSAFQREKDKPKMGPAGGNGGRGGSVFLVGDEGLNTLAPYTHVQATRGQRGMGHSRHGESGKDEYLEVPLGTVVREEETGGLIGEVLAHGEKLRVARGGRGGRGNKAFKTHSDTAPTHTENGEPGALREISLELKLIADVGLVGIPNAGKSTLLAATTRAAPKIASYPFTTVVPNLGVWSSRDRGEFSSFVIADIPGLLEGAHEGVGMGVAFLRHIERCKLLVHVVDGSSEDPIGDFEAIRMELRLFSPWLAKKPSVVVLNKIDIPEVQEKMDSLLKGLREAAGHKRVMAISAATRENSEKLMLKLDKLLKTPELKDVSSISAEPLLEIDPQVNDIAKKTFVDQVAPGEWRITGSRIEKAAHMTNWDYQGSQDRFIRILNALGATEKLKEQGAKDGDLIMVGNVDFVYFKERSTMAARARLAGFTDHEEQTAKQRETDELLLDAMESYGDVLTY